MCPSVGVSVSACESAPLCQCRLCCGWWHLCAGRWPVKTPSPGETRLAGSSASPPRQFRPQGQGG